MKNILLAGMANASIKDWRAIGS